MPEIQEQIHDYRWPGPCPPHPFSFPCDVCIVLSVHVCLTLSGYLSVKSLGPFVSLWFRTKRTLGLGSLYGENDLLDLDGDPLRERQVAEKQLAALGDIL